MNLTPDFQPAPSEVWHPWWALEEVKHNMWGDVVKRQTWLQIAATFTADSQLYGHWMRKVVNDWPTSRAHNLTKPGDKRAWIGHAAVAYAIGCPEDIVRAAWPLLTDEQREKANAEAQAAIELWRANA
jgi:hypothetical protein